MTDDYKNMLIARAALLIGSLHGSLRTAEMNQSIGRLTDEQERDVEEWRNLASEWGQERVLPLVLSGIEYEEDAQ